MSNNKELQSSSILNQSAYNALSALHKPCFIEAYYTNYTSEKGTYPVECTIEAAEYHGNAFKMWKQNKPFPLDFGDYCTIEQKRFGIENEHYVHKVIGRLISNTWVDVPVYIADKDEKIHDEVQPVLLCICCGVDETIVKRYLETDCKPNLVNKK